MNEKPAGGVKGFILYNHFDKTYFFRVYSETNKREFIDYDIKTEEIEVEILNNFTSLYDDEPPYIGWSSAVLGKQ